MKILIPNPNALDHKKVAEQFGLELEYVGFFPVQGKDRRPKYVYRIIKPKDDNEYFVLDIDFQDHKVFKHPVTKAAVSAGAKVNALHCKKCDVVIYSADVHDWRQCKCKGEKYCFVDGGFEYMRYGGDFEQFEVGVLNLLNDTFRESKKEEK